MWGSSLARAWQNAGEYLNLEKATDLVDKARAAARDVSDSVQAEYRRTFVDLDCHIFTVRPQLIVIEFPSEEKIDRLATRLNGDFAQRMLIYNMSERKYDRSKLQGEIIDVAFRGLPAPPLELVMELCLSAQHWLASDVNNVLVVHCFQGYSRSAVFLSCLMAFQGLCGDTVDALCEVCERLGIDVASAIVPSQRRYLMYFQQCQQGHLPAHRRWRLLRVQLNGIPRFESEGSVIFKPYIEIWNHGELVHTSLPRCQREGGRIELPDAVYSGEHFVCFNLPPDIFVTGDVLIRVRHVYPDGSRETALRFAFHTGFITDGLQLSKRELDTACNDARFAEDSFLDLALQLASPGGGAGPTPVAGLFEKAREVSKRLQETRGRDSASAAPCASGAAIPDSEARLLKTLAEGAAEDELRACFDTRPSPRRLEARPLPTQAVPGALDDLGACLTSEPRAPPPPPNMDAIVKDSQDEIDQLFSDFDAAMDSMVAGVRAPPSL